MPESGLIPSDRSLRHRIAAHLSWAATEDPSARTAPGRAAFEARFYEGIPEDLPQAERDRRAGQRRRAYFLDLARRSAEARRKKAGAA